MNPRIGFPTVPAAALIPGDRIVRPDGGGPAAVASVVRSHGVVAVVLHDSTAVTFSASTRISLRA